MSEATEGSKTLLARRTVIGAAALGGAGALVLSASEPASAAAAPDPWTFYADSHLGNAFGVRGAPYGAAGHRGQDFNGWPLATVVPAYRAGVVVQNAYLGDLGWSVVVRYDDPSGPLWAGFCHLVAQSPFGYGHWFNRGDPLGALGSTGNSSGPHLHTTLSAQPNPGLADRDPLPYIRSHLAVPAVPPTAPVPPTPPEEPLPVHTHFQSNIVNPVTPGVTKHLMLNTNSWNLATGTGGSGLYDVTLHAYISGLDANEDLQIWLRRQNAATGDWTSWYQTIVNGSDSGPVKVTVPSRLDIPGGSRLGAFASTAASGVVVDLWGASILNFQ